MAVTMTALLNMKHFTFCLDKSIIELIMKDTNLLSCEKQVE